jgi:stage II sporulation protein P
MQMRKQLVGLSVLLFFCLANTGVCWATGMELTDNTYYTLVDENNNVIHQTALPVTTDDIYISADNTRYKVTKVEDKQAYCKNEGQEAMPELFAESNQQAQTSNVLPVAKNAQQPTIAIYHTHDDESYVPTDGKESIKGDGGIYDVGKALADKLTSMGFNVQYSDNKHDPHDVNAYNRSRKTAANLLKTAPDVIIDVHRDATPPKAYKTTLNGVDATKIKLVVGRSNPNMKTNMEFAKTLKAAMDKKVPGLSNGIFIGKGSYNQDLSPRSMLIEVGSHTNKKEEAQQGIKMFAEILPTVLGVTPNAPAAQPNEPAKKPLTKNNQGAGTALLFVLGAVVLGGGAFYLINSKGGAK